MTPNPSFRRGDAATRRSVKDVYVAEHRRAKGRPGVKWLVIGAAAIVGALVLAGGLLVLAAGGGVRPGATVAGVDIGGMSRDEAIATLQDSLGKQAATPIQVQVADQEFDIDPAAAGLAFDAAATVDQAGGRDSNPLALIASLLQSTEVTPVVTVDTAALDAQLDSVALAVDVPAQEPTVDVQEGEIVAKPGSSGRALDRAALATALEQALLADRQPVVGTIVDSPPTVSDDAVAQAEELARTAISRPVRVVVDGTKAKIPKGTIADALSFRAENGALVPELNGALLHEAIADRLADLETPGRDASFEIKDGKTTIVPSLVGRGVSDDELATKVASVLGNPKGSRKVEVTIGTREPKFTTEQAESLGDITLLSTFTQKFPYAAYRVQNIGQAGRYIDGTVLMPGETFSLNDTIKERTEANGYTVGFVIGPGGIFAEELGGGVSASATATWTAAFFAGMERVYTQAHSIYISRYQPGLEATVGWGMFDMSFKNPYSNPVFITTSSTNTSLTVSFWGIPEYDEIKAEFGPRHNIRPFTKIIDRSKKCLGQDGVDGFDIDVDRVFYKGGVEVKRETISTSYRPAPKVVCKKKKDDAAEGDIVPVDPTAPSAGPTPEATPMPTETAPNPGAATGSGADPASLRATRGNEPPG